MTRAPSGELRTVLAAAREAARARRQTPCTAHVLLAMVQGGGAAGALLGSVGVEEGALVSAMKVSRDEPHGAIDLAVERASALATKVGAAVPAPLHLLDALVRDGRTAARVCLERAGVDVERLRAEVFARIAPLRAPEEPRRAARPALGRPTAPRMPTAFGTAPRALPSLRNTRVAAPAAPASVPPPAPAPTPPVASPTPEAAPASTTPAELLLDPKRFPMLTALGRNLTALAAEGRIDPVVGRDAEIEALLDALSRRRANSALLVGPPGVGKTAVVEGLAQRLAARALLGERGPRIVIEVQPGALLAGTGVRGAVAERIAKLRAEVARAEGTVLLFFDEIHALVGEGGPDDVATELKGALARGELACVGATTDAEHKRTFDRDPALARRFSRIDVGEPSVEDATRILAALAPSYESHHGVAVSPEAVRDAVELTVRWLPEQRLPDKALSVLDLAAARVRRREGTVVDRDAVARVVAELAHVPFERLAMRDGERLLALEAHLGARVVGQTQPVARIAEALRRAAAGFRGARPLGTFLLLGPTGVGKTETAKAVSDLLFSTTDLVRVDMSEHSEPHSVARLFGAPPGYVGHDDGGQLTEAVRRRPFSLVLLDEIEKAHPDVLLAFLPMLDEGRLTDGRGRTVDFKNTVVVMTSNLGAAAATERARSIGFGGAAQPESSQADRALAAARRALPPELWNRIDEPLYFGPLSEDDVAEIATRMLRGVREALYREHGIDLGWDRSAIDALVRAGGFDATLGARPMRRTVARLVEGALATRVLGGELVRGDAVMVRGDGDRTTFERVREQAAE